MNNLRSLNIFAEVDYSLDTIEENINICCAVTMEPDEVLELVDKLRKFLNEQRDK